jgi:hypothetical protein
MKSMWRKQLKIHSKNIPIEVKFAFSKRNISNQNPLDHLSFGGKENLVLSKENRKRSINW